MGKNITVKLLAKDQDCNLDGSHVLVGISVGQSNHYSKNFQATVESLKKTGIKACTFLVADVLQRHNLRRKSPSEDNIALCQRARELGGQWIRGNSKYIDILKEAGIDVTILRWDECINDDEYKADKIRVDQLYSEKNEQGSKFKQGIDDTVGIFVERRAKKYKKPENFKRDIVTATSTEYVKEECAAIAKLGQTGKYDYFLYPDDELEAMRVTREYLIQQKTLRWVKISISATTADPQLSSLKKTQEPSYMLSADTTVFQKNESSIPPRAFHRFFNGNGRVIAFMPDDADQELFELEGMTLSFLQELHILKAELISARGQNNQHRVDELQAELRKKKDEYVYQLNLERSSSSSLDSDEEVIDVDDSLSNSK